MILASLFLAHLIGDFLLQPLAWIEDRNARHHKSIKLIYHCLVHTLLVIVALLPLVKLVECFLLGAIVFFSHFAIDVWKSFRPSKLLYFALDQILHVLVLVAIAAFASAGLDFIKLQAIPFLYQPKVVWIAVGLISVTYPTALVVGLLTEHWRKTLNNAESLAKAGLWIGSLERVLIFFFVLIGKYEAIGFLITAKSLLRFSDKDNQNQARNTEYVLVGTLLSFVISVLLSFCIKQLIEL